MSAKTGSGVRNLKQRVKTANKRSLSSQKWLERLARLIRVTPPGIDIAV